MSANGNALATRQAPLATLIRPVATVSEMVEVEKIYQDAIAQILVPSDYQEFTEKSKGETVTRKFRKKSGWRKLQRFFGVSCEGIREEERTIECTPAYCVTDCPGHHYEVKAYYRATAPNGQYAEGEASCIDIEDAPDPREVLRRRTDWKNAENYLPQRKSRHDVLSTAGTRAYNRAVSNLIAAGEVSAEEIRRPSGQQPQEPSQAEIDAKHRKDLVREIYGILGIDPKSKDRAEHAKAITETCSPSGIAAPEKWGDVPIAALKKFIEYKRSAAPTDADAGVAPSASPDAIEAEYREVGAASATVEHIAALLNLDGTSDDDDDLQSKVAELSMSLETGIVYVWRHLPEPQLLELLEWLKADQEIPL